MPRAIKAYWIFWLRSSAAFNLFCCCLLLPQVFFKVINNICWLVFAVWLMNRWLFLKPWHILRCCRNLFFHRYQQVVLPVLRSCVKERSIVYCCNGFSCIESTRICLIISLEMLCQTSVCQIEVSDIRRACTLIDCHIKITDSQRGISHFTMYTSQVCKKIANYYFQQISAAQKFYKPFVNTSMMNLTYW